MMITVVQGVLVKAFVTHEVEDGSGSVVTDIHDDGVVTIRAEQIQWSWSRDSPCPEGANDQGDHSVLGQHFVFVSEGKKSISHF